MQIDERKAEMAGPPCRRCVNYIDGKPPSCGHLAYTHRVYNHIRGEFIERPTAAVNIARGDEGLCGPEALLFEPPPRLPAAWARVRQSRLAQNAAGAAALVAIAAALYL